MNQTEGLDKNVMGLLGTLGVFVVFLLLYFFPRASRLSQADQEIQELQGVRQEVSVLLPEVARTFPTTPLPQPDVRSWIAANSLAGIEKNLVANDGYLQGQGAQVRLRRLTPSQAARFLSTLTRVRLIVERLQMQDSDGDGRWDMEINVKVPNAK